MAICSVPKNIELQSLLEENFAGKHIPIDGMIELTHKCNFKCIHCYGKNERVEKDLSFKQWISIFTQLKDEGCLSIALTGGEVLCRNDFIDLYIELKKMGFIVVVLSNASMLTEEIAKVFYDYPLAYFSTTMYGFSRETYKRVTGSAENYDKFISGLNLLEKYKIPIELKTVALKENYNDMESIYKFSVEKGYPFRCSTNIRATNDGNLDTTSHAISPEERLKLDTEILKNVSEFWKEVAIHPKPQPKTDQKRRDKCKYLCNAGNNGFMIDADGYAHVCIADRKHRFSLLDHSFKECWNSFIPSVVSEKAKDNFPCLECEDFRYCEQCSAQMDLENCDNINKCLLGDRCKLAKLRHEWCNKYASECKM